MGTSVVVNGGTFWGDQFARLVQDHIGTNPVLFEIGAFDGKDVDLFLEVLPRAKVFAFEASPDTFMAHKLGKRKYRAFNVAIGERDGTADFHESKDRPTSSLLPGEHPWKTVKVPICRLDTLIKEGTLPVPSVIKIDTEGYTYQVLEGLGEYLPRVEVLYLETEDKQYWKGQKLHDDVVKLIEPYFSCLTLHDNNHQFDSIWLQKRRESA
ncbi:MAG: hypothetical protein C5B59_12845 [Bacteroidetes bacterium]|nr:MAG: hypothetical protein C5B59_12845 [Bacteroidota bacterium]